VNVYNSIQFRKASENIVITNVVLHIDDVHAIATFRVLHISQQLYSRVSRGRVYSSGDSSNSNLLAYVAAA